MPTFTHDIYVWYNTVLSLFIYILLYSCMLTRRYDYANYGACESTEAKLFFNVPSKLLLILHFQ